MDIDQTPKEKGYKKTFQSYGESPKALQWLDYRSAAIRYRQLLSELDIENRSILDVGCGMGDLLPFIYSRCDKFEYLGVDVVPEFIDVAKKRYEGHQFRLLNPFIDQMDSTFDIVVLCGALNSNKTDWLNKRKEKIVKLFELTNEALTFNMAGALLRIEPDQRVAYADTKEILEFCSNLTPKIIIKTHYHPKDFTVVMFK